MSKSKSKTAVTSVHVIGENGDRLMPTFKFGLVRHLLKDRKAKAGKNHLPGSVHHPAAVRDDVIRTAD